MSLPEVLLWTRLRRSGLHIRRQHPVGPYVADFFCEAARTVIEIDGAMHDLRMEADAVRDATLGDLNLITWRLSARDVLADPDTAAETILRTLRLRIAAHTVTGSDLPPPEVGEVPSVEGDGGEGHETPT